MKMDLLDHLEDLESQDHLDPEDCVESVVKVAHLVQMANLDHEVIHMK